MSRPGHRGPECGGGQIAVGDADALAERDQMRGQVGAGTQAVVGQDGGDRVGEERDREGDEHTLGLAVGPAHDDQPDAKRRHRD